ncbi:MAG TPA: hypothetical protein VJV74_04225, partial [Terriglobia bacterium]|nr:hypothetical protein [Terriglobia bacterium]
AGRGEVAMLTHHYISEEWMLSTRARQVYRLSAFGTLALFVGLLALILVGPLPAAATPAAKFIIFVGAVAMATVWTAMEYFLFGFDRLLLGRRFSGSR